MQVDVHRAEGAKTSYIRMGLKRKAVPKSKRVTTINPSTNEVTTTVVVKKRGRPTNFNNRGTKGILRRTADGTYAFVTLSKLKNVKFI